MKISWLGHASFLLETQEATKILTDPYEPSSVGYDAIDVEPDIITVSHQHFDHNYTKGFSKAKIVSATDPVTIKDVKIEGIATFHDKEQGSSRGKNIIFIILADDLRIAHFGDVGTLDLDYSKLTNIDIAFVPVGGTFTIDSKEAGQLLEKINPKIFIPMHFKTNKLKFDIAGVEPFIAGKDHQELPSLDITPDNIGAFKKIVVLEHQR